MSTMNMGGLRLDQAPPLRLPSRFFLMAPVAVVGAGMLLLENGASLLSTPWSSGTIALTHLGTLGLLSMVMLGALYQFLPVVAGVSVPRIWIGYGVFALFLGGVSALVGGLLATSYAWMWVAQLLLGLSLAAFLGPLAWSLWHAPTQSDTVTGLRMGMLHLLLVATLGLWMAHGHSGMPFPGPRAPWIQVHMTVGFLGWIGSVLTAVSWQVVPMFYLTPTYPTRTTRLILWLISLGVLGPTLLILSVGWNPEFAPILSPWAFTMTLPALLGVAIVHPWVTLRAIRRRRRKKIDGSLRFWRVAMSTAPFAGGTAIMAYLSPDPRWTMACIWLTLWGWAAGTAHGMLSRIVPFLVWFHRFSRAPDPTNVPSMRELLPDRWTRVNLILHYATLTVGLGAIGTGSDWLARGTGILLITTGVSLFGLVAWPLWQGRAELKDAISA